jgi:hypothetical protein
MAICYLIKQLNSRKKSYYKIGVSSSKNQRERLRHLQIGNPHKLVIIKTHKLQTKHLAEKLEQYILRELDSSNIKRCQGEWVFGDSKKIELTFNNCFKKFSLLKEEDIKNMKRWSFGRGGINPQKCAIKSLKERRRHSEEWAASVGLKKEIQNAGRNLKNPTIRNVCKWLNGEGSRTRRGNVWTAGTLHSQMTRFGWDFKELVKR